MKSAIVVLKEHHTYLGEELKSERKRLGDAEKTRSYHAETVARKEIELAEVNAAIAKLEAL